MMLATIQWDPDPYVFVIPGLNHPITWYGVLFAFGIVIAYFLVRHLFFFEFKEKKVDHPKEKASHLVDRLSLFVVISGIVGARLGHVFFYGWPYYSAHPIDIIKVWEGGLASHGGAIGVFIGLILFWLLSKKKFSKGTFLFVLDGIVVGTAFLAGCIRIGNFMNQEILGTPTGLPWGVVFGHPLERAPQLPLHPVQLYESLFYFSVFTLLWLTWRGGARRLGSGVLSGLFFTFVFGFRFFIELVKLPQSESLGDGALLNMGQILSIPFFFLGLWLLVRVFYTRKRGL